MKIYVKTLTGKTIELAVEPTDLVSELKNKLHDKEGCRPEQQRIIYMGKQLEDPKSLNDCGVPEEATLFLVLHIKQEEVTGTWRITYYPRNQISTIYVRPDKTFTQHNEPLDPPTYDGHWEAKNNNVLLFHFETGAAKGIDMECPLENENKAFCGSVTCYTFVAEKLNKEWQ